MGNGKPSEFFLTGIATAWPLLWWAGFPNAATVMFVALLAAAVVCALVEDGGDDPESGDGGGGGPRGPERVPRPIRRDGRDDR